MRRLLLGVLVLATACGGGTAPTFNRVGDKPATAPATAPVAPANGSSDVTLSGALTYRATMDFQCTHTKDDFFVRGSTGEYDGVPVYVSINVEHFSKPGRYQNRVQVLIRRVSRDDTTYESWYADTASATVLPPGKGVDLDVVTLPPERGTSAKSPLTAGGHFGCLAPPSTPADRVQ